MSTKEKCGVRFLLEGVVINVIMISYRKFTEVMPEHAHGENVYEIHLVTDGEGKVILEKREHRVFPGMLYITGPGVLHEQIPGSLGAVTEFGLYLQVENHPEGGDLFRGMKDNPAWLGEGGEKVLSLARQILSEQKGIRPGSVEMLPHLLAEFLIECIRRIFDAEKCDGEGTGTEVPAPEERFSTQPVREQNILLVMDEIFLYEYRDLTLQSLAGRLGFSIRQTQRMLMKCYGKTFTQKKSEARMSAAVTLLENSSCSITEISERVGYSSMEHFSHAFRQYYGYVPGKVRKRKAVIRN